MVRCSFMTRCTIQTKPSHLFNIATNTHKPVICLQPDLYKFTIKKKKKKIENHPFKAHQEHIRLVRMLYILMSLSKLILQ